MSAYEDIKLEGHIIDSLLLPRVLDEILERGGEYRILRFRMGREKDDHSLALLRVSASNEEQLETILRGLQQHGVEIVEQDDVRVEPAPCDGVFPEDFYSTTNLETFVRTEGRWIAVQWPEMDCGIVVDRAAGSACTVPLIQVRAGDEIVVGSHGIRAVPLGHDRASRAFEFMGSAVSSEKPKRLVVAKVARLMREVRTEGKKIVAVLGPAVVHTGAAPAFAKLVAGGWIDVVLGGNAVATHDIESALFNTSLGINLSEGESVEGGHEHHLRAINRVRRCGGIRQAVDQGVLTSGLFYEIVRRDIPYVLAGSIRDDGPLPDVITDAVEAQQAMREHVREAGLCMMLCSMLHSIATGNLLPATVATVCVDINPAVATKLSDRGSFQTIGIVTDVGLFLDELVAELEAAPRG
ncbi:MAG: TIGR00300 family protein [Actinobacteria bacterium RBG_16_64_13]|nr:MAG: TIGR00300 family protein [Actinobacteria bacterium RBG_16_64_13]